MELAQFHSPDYVEFLQRITPDKQDLFATEMAKCTIFFVFLFNVWYFGSSYKQITTLSFKVHLGLY